MTCVRDPPPSSQQLLFAPLQSHRTLSRVRGASSPRLMVVFVLVSAVVAAITVPFGDVWLASGLSVYQNGETPVRLWVKWDAGALWCMQSVLGLQVLELNTHLLADTVFAVKQRVLRIGYVVTLVFSPINSWCGEAAVLSSELGSVPFFSALTTVHNTYPSRPRR